MAQRVDRPSVRVRWAICALLLAVVSLPVSHAQDVSGTVAGVTRQIDAGQYREALLALAPVLKQDAADARLHVLRGRAQLALHQDAAAVDSFRQAVEVESQNGRYHYWLGQALAQRIPQAGVISKASLAGDLRNAYLRAVALAPDFIPAREALLDFYVQAPSFVGGSLGKAREQAAAIARLSPARGSRAQAVILAAEGHVQEAIKGYKTAIHQDPVDAGLRVDLGELYLKQGYPQEACAVFQQALKLVPDHVETLEQLGRAAIRSGQRDDLQAGAQSLRHLLALSPETVSMMTVRQHLATIESMLQPQSG